MVKKLAVVTAAVAATLLALSPLALATDKPHHHHGKSDNDKNTVIGDQDSPSNQNGLVNLGDVNALNGVNVCPDVNVIGGILGKQGGDPSCNSLSGNNDD